jgi:hypothetical protein
MWNLDKKIKKKKTRMTQVCTFSHLFAGGNKQEGRVKGEVEHGVQYYRSTS